MSSTASSRQQKWDLVRLYAREFGREDDARTRRAMSSFTPVQQCRCERHTPALLSRTNVGIAKRACRAFLAINSGAQVCIDGGGRVREWVSGTSTAHGERCASFRFWTALEALTMRKGHSSMSARPKCARRRGSYCGFRLVVSSRTLNVGMLLVRGVLIFTPTKPDRRPSRSRKRIDEPCGGATRFEDSRGTLLAVRAASNPAWTTIETYGVVWLEAK